MLGAKIQKSPRCHPIPRSSLLSVPIYTCDITVAAVKAYAVVNDLLPALESPFGASTHTALTAPAALFDEKNVRYYYRKFLALCRKHGLEPECGMVTTEMMRTIAVETWGDEESVDELTMLYRDVRYGGKKDEEPERKTAKSLFKNLKSLAENKKTT